MTSKHGNTIWIHEENKNEKVRRLEKELRKLEEERDLIEKIERLKRKNNGCFISTACVEAQGLPDDCLELTTLRQFRDNTLVYLPKGREAIKEYYAVAPGIVEKINQRGDKNKIYTGLFDNLVKRSVDLVLVGKHEEAFSHYKNIVAQLKAIYS